MLRICAFIRAIAGICFFSIVARADNLASSVSFRITEGVRDGTEPFVCNAGIRHGVGGDVLRFTSAQFSAPQFRFGAGEYNSDSMAVSEPNMQKLGYSYYASLNNPLHTLVFSFASELLGAEYFVDVCYPPLGFSSEGSAQCRAMGIPGTHCSQLQVVSQPLPNRMNTYPSSVQLKLRAEKIGNDGCTFAGFPGTPSDWVLLSPNSHPFGFGWQQSGNEACVIRYYFWESAKLSRAWPSLLTNIEISAKIADRPRRNCTLTQGYWKNHAGCGRESQGDTFVCGNRKYDSNWSAVTFPLGNGKFPAQHVAGALESLLPSAFSLAPILPNEARPEHPLVPFMNSGTSWLSLLNTPPSGGNAFLVLAHQWMATSLNLAAGASFELAGSDAELVRSAWLSGAVALWNGGGESDAASWLDWFNNGGNGGIFHCSDYEDPGATPSQKPQRN